MSISLLLVPLAVATATAWEMAHAEPEVNGQRVCRVETRMRDVTLLQAALGDTGAAVRQEDGVLLAQWQDVEARFSRDPEDPQQIWAAHLTGQVDEARAVEIVQAIDRAYGRRVQAAVVERVKQRSGSAGMRLLSESMADDESVTLVLAVERQERS